jgi:hypothetical protein
VAPVVGATRAFGDAALGASEQSRRRDECRRSSRIGAFGSRARSALVAGSIGQARALE